MILVWLLLAELILLLLIELLLLLLAELLSLWLAGLLSLLLELQLLPVWAALAAGNVSGTHESQLGRGVPFLFHSLPPPLLP
jgi:hypothetical protein